MYYILLPQNFWRYVKPQKVQITLWCLHFNTVPKGEIQCPPPHLQLAQNAPEGLIETLYLKFSRAGKRWRPSHTLLTIMSHDISTPENQDTPLVWSDTHVLAKWPHRPREKEKAGSKGRLYMQAHSSHTAPLSCPLQNSNHSRDKLLGSCGDKTQYSWSIQTKKIGRPLPHIGLLSKKSNNDYFDVRVLIEILIEH